MKNETKTLSEYKAPRCKMVEVQMRSNLLQASQTTGGYSLGRPGDDTDINELGELD